jgi:hypothetical protein
MDHMLPCNFFLRGGDFRWPVTNHDKVAGREFEVKNLTLVIQKYESKFGIHEADFSYADTMWDEPVEGVFVERLFRRHKLPGGFLNEYLWNVYPRDRNVVRDLDLLRRVRRWYMTDVEE